MPDTHALALPLHVPGQAQRHEKHNEALHTLDAVVQLAVKDRSLAAPPSTPAAGDRYIVASGPTGAWSGHALDVADWDGSAWRFHEAREGWRAWVQDEDALLIFDGTAWVDIGSAIKVLQNLSLIGIGTSADGTNPFAAKLNKALWTARTAAEGGDGDLRYTMSKETAADVLSLLFQTGFSGRAEFGLIGDDELAIKVSADGSTWIEPFRIGHEGRIIINHNLPGLPPTDPSNGTVQLHILGSDDELGRQILDGFGHHAVLSFRRCQGTKAAPTNVGAGNSLGALNGFGYGSTDYCTENRVAIDFQVAENWTDTAQGTHIDFSTTKIGTVSKLDNMRLTDAGWLGIGTLVPKAKLAVSANSSVAPTALSDVVAQLHGGDGLSAKAEIVSHGGSGQIAFRRSEGTASAPEATANGQIIFALNAFGHDGSAWGTSSRSSIQVTAGGLWSPTSQPTSVLFRVTPVGSTTIFTALGISPAGDLQMGASLDTVVGANRHFRLRSYTVAGLPAATTAGELIYISNGASNKRLAVSDGTNWRFPDGAVVS